MKKSKIILPIAVLLISAVALASGGGHEEHGEVTIPWQTIKFQAINLGVLLIALIYFMRGAVKESFAAREKNFLDESQKTARALKEAEEALKDSKKKLADLEAGEKQSIANAEKEAVLAAEKIVNESTGQAKKMVEDTQLIISAEIVRAKNEIREQIINMSLAQAEKGIQGASSTITQKSEKGFLTDLEQVKS